jgi:PAS domain S-box-containing protein
MRQRTESKEDLLKQIADLKRRIDELEASQRNHSIIEHALTQSELRFKTLAEKSLVGIYIVRDKLFCYVNPRFAEIFGYEVEELIDVKDMHMLVHKNDLTVFRENIRKRLSGEVEAVQYQFRGIRKNGNLIHVEVYGSRIDLDGRPAIIGSLIDITSRIETERALRSSERLYRSLIETMGESFGIQDTSGVITYVNDRMCELWGLAREDMLGRGVMEFLDDVNRKILLRQLQNRADGIRKAYEIVWTAQGGRKIPTKVSPEPIFDEDGNFMGSFAVITDLSELKAAQKAMEDEKRKFEVLCENLPFGVVLIGKKGEFNYMNPAFRFITGYGWEDISSGQEWFRLAFPDPTLRSHAVTLWKQDWHESARGQERSRTFSVTCKDGKEKIILFRPVQLGDRSHLMTCEDTTVQMEKEQVLQEREMRFRTIFQKGPLGMVLLRLDFTWIAFNDRYAEMLGYTVDELKRISLLELTHPEDLDSAKQYYFKLQRREIETCNYQKRYMTKNGEIIWVEVTDSIIQDETGDDFYILGMIENITEKKLRADQLEASLREKDVLLREIHHRVKNNLQVISSLFRLQSRYCGNEDLDEVLRESQSRIEAISLVHEQLYKSKELARIDIGKYLGSLMSSLAALHGVTKSQIVTKVEKGIYVTIDLAMPLGLIAHELVMNSFKHSGLAKNGAKIALSFSVYKGACELLISDEGSEFPVSLDTDNPATMGLRLVKILSKQIRGRISIRNQGRNEFRITFPSQS